MSKRELTPGEVSYIYGVAGRLMSDILVRVMMRPLGGRMFVDPAEARPKVAFNTDTQMVEEIAFPDLACPFVTAHELGHAFHCTFWPRETAEMGGGGDFAEAIAVAAEFHYKASGAALPGEWERRSWLVASFLLDNPRVLDLLTETRQDAEGSFCAQAEAIIARFKEWRSDQQLASSTSREASPPLDSLGVGHGGTT